MKNSDNTITNRNEEGQKEKEQKLFLLIPLLYVSILIAGLMIRFL